jgi:hypothetical protein
MSFGATDRTTRLKITSLLCGLALLLPVAATISRDAAVDTAKVSVASDGVTPLSTLDDGLHW